MFSIAGRRFDHLPSVRSLHVLGEEVRNIDLRRTIPNTHGRAIVFFRYFKIGILARRATAHLAQLADQHESHQAASQAFRKVPSLGLWPVTSGLKVIFGYFLGGAANARRVVKNAFSACFGDVSSAPWWQTDPCR